MSAKSKSKSVLRSVKNFTKGYSDIEIKVRDATSNDPNLPSTTLMGQISAATNTHYMFMEVMNILDKRLNDKGKNWRHVYKALIVLDYLIHDGSDQVLAYIRDNMFIVKTLQQFQYIDEEGKDYGIAVRTKAKDLVSLLEHPETLTEERTDRDYWMTRFTTDDTHSRVLDSHRHSPPRKSNSIEDLRSKSHSASSNRNRALSNSSIPSYSEREDADLKKALEESKRLAELEKEQRERSEEELKLALELSYYEAQNRKLRGPISSSDNSMQARSSNEPMGDLLDLFEGPPATSVPQGYIMNNNTAINQQPFGLQMNARQLLGDGGLESVKLNPTFSQGSFGYIPDHNSQQGNMYPKPSILREQQITNIPLPKHHASNTIDPFSDLVPSNALVSSNPSILSSSGNPFTKSECMTPPSRLSDFDPYSTLGLQTIPQKITGIPEMQIQNMPMLPSSLPNNFNNPLLSNSTMMNPMNINQTAIPPVILHPTNAVSGQYPMNPPFPSGNNMNHPGQSNNNGFPQSRQFY